MKRNSLELAYFKLIKRIYGELDAIEFDSLDKIDILWKNSATNSEFLLGVGRDGVHISHIISKCSSFTLFLIPCREIFKSYRGRSIFCWIFPYLFLPTLVANFNQIVF